MNTLFPNSRGSGKYAIVQMRIDAYFYNDWQYKDYVFVFQTIELQRKDVICSKVYIEVSDINKMNYFDQSVQDADKHIYTGGTLSINEYIDIVEVKTPFQTMYFANLKKQLYEDKESCFLTSSTLLLLTENRGSEGRINNLPASSFSPEFQLLVDSYRSEEKTEELWKTQLNLMSLKNEVDDNQKEQLDNFIDLIKAKEDRYRDERMKLSKTYAAYRKRD